MPGAEVTVWRVRDPVKGDDHAEFDEGVLDAPVVTVQARGGAHAVVQLPNPVKRATTMPSSTRACWTHRSSLCRHAVVPRLGA